MSAIKKHPPESETIFLLHLDVLLAVRRDGVFGEDIHRKMSVPIEASVNYKIKL